MSKRKLRRELSEFSRKTESTATLYSGSLGIYIGGTQYVDVPNRPGFVYVRLRNNISELIQAHNEVVSPVYGLPVILIRNKTYYEIYGRDSVQYGSYWDSNSSYLPKHGHQHEFDPDNNGGGDLVFVHGEQFYPMMTFPSGSDGGNTVLIAPYRYFYQGLWHYTGNTGVGDLLQYGPTGANNAKLLLVGTTSATGNPFVKLGSEFSEGITGAAALTQFVPTNITPIDEIPGAIIRLVTGTETITWANIYDARQYMGILQAGSGTGGGATDFLGLSDTPNSYASQANKLVTVKADESGLEFRTNTGSFGSGSHILNVVDDLGGLASGDNNDYAPTGYDSTTDVIIVYGDPNNTSRITGITGGTNGRKLTIINGADNRVNISSGGGGSSAGNTIETNSSEGISIRTYEAVSLIWYTSLGEWVIVDDHKIRDTFWIDSSVTGTVTANQNNWSLTVFDAKAVFLMSPTADRDITGISSANGTKHGQVLTFINNSPTFTLTFKNESGSSTAANRFSMGADLAVGPGKSATFWYDKFAQRWRNTSSTSSGNTDAIILDTFFASYPLASGNNNNYNPSGYASDTNIIIVYGNSDGTSVITGLAGGRNGREVTIHNSEYKVNLAHLSGASDADKVFVFNTTDGITLGENESITLYYDTGWNRWFALEDRRERDVTIVPPGYAYLITGSINDWSDYRLYKNTIFTLNATGNYNITGLYPFNNNQELTFINIGTGTVVTFQNEATGSTASYRLSMGSDNALGPGKSITLWYDAVSTRWRALDFTATGSSGGSNGGTTLGLGFYGQDEAVGLGTGTTLNVVGNDISLSISGTVLTLLHSDPTGTPHSFLDLTDTPDSYSSQGSKYVAVNSGATALEFVTAPAGGGGGSGLVVYDDSVYKITGTAISFDSNLSVTVTGSVAYVSTSLAFGTSSRTAGDLTTTSTSFVDADATNLKVTITTSARRCLVLVNAMIFNSGANTTALDLDIDGVRQGDTLGLSFMNGTNPVPGSFEFITGVLSAASHTFKLQWKVSAGTGTMFANTTTARATISVEELPLIS